MMTPVSPLGDYAEDAEFVEVNPTQTTEEQEEEQALVKVQMGSRDSDFVIKVALGQPPQGDLRRLFLKDIADNQSRPSYRLLFQKLSTLLLPPEDSSEQAAIKLSYQDLDMDSILISSTKELVDAIAQFQDHGSLKLVATIVEEDASSQARGAQKELFGSSAQVITNASVGFKMLRELFKAAPPPSNMVEYKGNLMTKTDKMVLEHIVDKFQDHITPDFAPKFEVTGDKVVALYNIGESICRSNFFAIDGIFLNLTGFTDNSATVTVCIPFGIRTKVNSLWRCPLQSTRTDRYHSDLEEVSVKFDKVTPPMFTFVTKDENGSIAVTPKGVLPEFAQCPNNRRFHRVTGFFTATKGRIRMNGPTVVMLTLVGLRAFSVHDELVKTEGLRNV